MNAPEIVIRIAKVLTERERRAALIRTMKELHESWDWQDLINAVHDARYQAGLTDETDDSEWPR